MNKEEIIKIRKKLKLNYIFSPRTVLESPIPIGFAIGFVLMMVLDVVMG